MCAGPVYEYKKQKIGKDKWKESWLSLDDNGALNWSKQRDDKILATADIQKCYRQIKFESFPNENCSFNDVILTSFVMNIPMTTKTGETSSKRFSVKSVTQLQGWMESFAKSLSKLETMKKVQEAYGTEARLSNSLNNSKKDFQFIVYEEECMPLFWKQFLESVT